MVAHGLHFRVEKPRGRRRLMKLAAVAGALLAAWLWCPSAGAQGIFIRGDCNQSLDVDISDAIHILSFLFLGEKEVNCKAACDVDNSAAIDITDAITLLTYLFIGGDPPAPPYPGEDVDPNEQGLGCNNGKLPVLELKASPERLLLHQLGETRRLLVIGIVPGGGRIDVSINPNTSYASDRPEIVAVDNTGLLTAAKVGGAAITIKHRRLTAAAAVEVLPGADGAPRLEVTSPGDGALLSAAAVLVSGWVSDPAAQVTLNGAGPDSGPDAAGRFARTVALAEGANTVAIAAQNASGKSSRTITLTRLAAGAPGPDGLPLPVLPAPVISPADTTPPSVRILSPAAGAMLFSAAVEVRGTVDDPQAAVRVNGVPAMLEGTSFTASGIHLPAGTSTLTAEAADRLGNRAADSITVTVDGAAPTIAITSPAILPGSEGDLPGGYALASTPTIAVHGLLGQPGMAVSVNGIPAAVNGTEFDANAPLEPGLNRIAALATLPAPAGEPAPKRVIGALRVVLDLAAPSIETVYPPDGAAVLAGSIVVAGRVSDDATALSGSRLLSLTVNGQGALLTRNRFARAVPLIAGPNAITLIARDGAGRETRRTLNVVRQLPLGGPSLAAVSGDGQTAAPLAPLAQPLVVEARDAANQVEANAAVTFEVALGDGTLEGGGRVKTAATDASGRASVRFTAGTMAGPQLVVARSSGRLGSPAAFLEAVSADESKAVLACRWGRWQTGTGGAELPEHLSVRALDRTGNPLSGVPVTFTVASGGALLGGSGQAVVSTNGEGYAFVKPLLPALNSLGEVIVEAPTGARLSFTLEGRSPGAPLDTGVSGILRDLGGHPIQGLRVRLLDLPGAEALSDAGGAFRFPYAPWGAVAVEVLPGAAAGGRIFQGARREFLAVPGRQNAIPDPIVLVEEKPGPRAASIFVSESAGGRLAIPELSGWSLEVQAGSARFPGGSRGGMITAAAASLRQFPAPAPDDTAVEAAAWIFPEGLRFDPPARLRAPAFAPRPGLELVLWGWSAGAGAIYAAGAGRVQPDGSFIETLPLSGPRRGGLYFFAVPGPAGGEHGAAEGQAEVTILNGGFVPQHAASPMAGIGVYAHSGELAIEATDLEIPGRGLDFRLKRRYKSRHDFQGILGWGWEQEYADRRLAPASSFNLLKARTGFSAQAVLGNILRADGLGRFDEYLFHAPTGKYISPIGIFSKLYRLADGTLIERDPGGTRYTYHPFDGTRLSGWLARLVDRNGNRLEMRRDADGRLVEVIDTLSRPIAFSYDGSGRLRSVTDFAGRTVAYGYDANGDLVTVTTPAVTETPNANDFPDGKTLRYRYRGGSGDRRLIHNLTAIYSPSQSGEGGLPWLANTYDEDAASPSFDRVLAQDWGGTDAAGIAAGGRYAFAYEIHAPPEVGASPAALLAEAGKTGIIDPRGLRREIVWNGAGLAAADRTLSRDDLGPRDATRLLPAPGLDPPFLETRYRYTGETLLAEVTRPRGDRILYEYDGDSPLRAARAWPVREVRVAPPGDPMEARPLIVERSYDPVFGQVARESAPRFEGEGAAPQTVRLLDYQEGTPVENLAVIAGAQVDDLEEALSRAGIALGLGDRNGDGKTDGAAGNAIATMHPAATLPDGTVQEAVELKRWNRFGQLIAEVDAEGGVTAYSYHPENDPEGDGLLNSQPGLDSSTGGYLAEQVVDAADPLDAGAPSAARLRTRYRYNLFGRLSQVTDGLGNATVLHHNARGQLVQATAPSPLNYRRRFYYDLDDRLARLEVENVTSTPNGFPFIVVDHRWIVHRAERDLLGQVVLEAREVSGGEVGPAQEAVTRYRYDGAGHRIHAVHPGGQEESWLYDERGLVYTHTLHPQGGGPPAVTTSLYDPNGGLVQVIGPEDVDGDGGQEARTFLYDGFGRLAAAIDELGGVTACVRNARGQAVEEAVLGAAGGPSPRDRTGGANVLLARTVHQYDERGRLVKTSRSRFGPGIDAGTTPAEETLLLDRRGRALKKIDAAGGEWTCSYDGAGRLRRAADPSGNSAAWDFDAAGRLARAVRTERSSRPIAPGAAGDPQYDAAGHLLETRATVYSHDALGRRTIEIGPSGSTRRFVYDSRNNVIYKSDAAGSPIAAGTDPKLAELLPLLTPEQAANANSHGNPVRTIYDNLDRPVHLTYELHRDGEGQGELDLTSPFNPDGLLDVEYRWDGNNRLQSWKNDRGLETGIVRDPFGRIASLIAPDGLSLHFVRDLKGNPRQIIDRNGTVLRQSFDALGRLVRREVERAADPGGAGAAVEGTTLQLFEWDGLSRLTLAYDNNRPEDAADDSLTILRRDSLGNLEADFQSCFEVSMRRDAAGRAVEIRYPGGRRVETPRDALGRVLEVGDGAWSYGSFASIGPERVLERSLGNGVGLSYLQPDELGIPRDIGYNRDDQITYHAWKDRNGEDVFEFAYGYDREARRLFERRLHLFTNLGDAYRYDSIGRLSLVVFDLLDPRVLPVNPQFFARYYFDGNHNARFVVVNFAETEIEVDQRDRLVKVGEQAMASDPAGRLVGDGVRQYRYDFLGRLARLESGGRTAALYAYDALGAERAEPRGPAGRLMLRDLKAPAPSDLPGRSRLIYLGERPIEERLQSGSLIKEYIQDPEGKPLAFIGPDAEGVLRTRFLLIDPMGTVSGISNEDGKLIETVRYGTYGLPTYILNELGNFISRSATGNTLYYRGHRLDETAGMYPLEGRFFSPAQARFLAPLEPALLPVFGAAVQPPDSGRSAFERLAPIPRTLGGPLGPSSSQAGQLEAPPLEDMNPYSFGLNDPIN